MKRGSPLSYIHGDHLTSLSVETNSSGNQTASRGYYAYGSTRSSSGSLQTDRTYTGQKSDGTGLLYYNARYYDPALGTFLSPDTIVPDAGAVIDYNRFLYVRGNPLRFSDPSGNEPCANGSMCQPGGPSGFGQGFDDWLQTIQAANVFRPGSRYYYVDGYGLFDMSHIHAGIARINEIRSDLRRNGSVSFDHSVQRGAIQVLGEYSVQDGLSPEALDQAILAIAMDYEHFIEDNQSPGSSYSVEDLPSDYLGFYIALHPGSTIEGSLVRLGNGRAPVGFGSIAGVVHKSFRQNQQYRPIPHRGAGNVNWPLQFQMTPAGAQSNTWARLNVDVRPDTRSTFQKTVDFIQSAWQTLR